MGIVSDCGETCDLLVGFDPSRRWVRILIDRDRFDPCWTRLSLPMLIATIALKQKHASIVEGFFTAEIAGGAEVRKYLKNKSVADINRRDATLAPKVPS